MKKQKKKASREDHLRSMCRTFHNLQKLVFQSCLFRVFPFEIKKQKNAAIGVL